MLKWVMSNGSEFISRNYSAPLVRIIIAWGNAPGAGVYEVKALKGRIKILNRPERACSLLFWFQAKPQVGTWGYSNSTPTGLPRFS